MKHVNIGFSDEEFEALKKEKGCLSWREFVMKMLANLPEFWRQV